MRRLPVLLLLLLLVGCDDDNDDDNGDTGGSAEVGAQATVAEYCELFRSDPPGIDSTDPDRAVAASHEMAEQMRELGTPPQLGESSGTTAEARRGFEVFVAGMAEVTYAELEVIREGEDDAFREVFGDDDGSAVETWLLASLDLCSAPE